MSYKFKCPYCFSEIEHTEVLFRSNTFFAPEEFDCTGKGRTREEIVMAVDDNRSESKHILDEYDKREKFSLLEDPIYDSWWRNFAGTTECAGENNFAEYNRPIITPKKNGVSEIIFNDDFATAVIDPWGIETNKRVCPHCHNPLPQGYGKYPVKNIIVIGSTGSGKTVYLSQLLEKIGYYLSNWELGCVPYGETLRFVRDNIVSVDKSLPAATYAHNFEQPLIINVSGRDKITETFVFYSIAGEECLYLSHSKHKSIFRNANGIILLVDPMNLLANIRVTEQILNEMIFSFGENTINIPTAICVSKSDKLKGILPEICFEDVKTEPNIFCSNDYNVISQSLSDLFERDSPILKKILTHSIDTYNFFAVSSLGKDCKFVSDDEFVLRLSSEPVPTRIEEPFGWLLKEFGLIKSDGNIFTPKNEAINEMISELSDELIQLEVEKSNIGLFKRNKQKEYKSRIAEIQEKINRLEEKKNQQ